MFRYLLKRLLLLVFTLFAVSVVVYGISLYAPSDPIEQLLQPQTGSEATTNTASRAAREAHYIALRHDLHFDLPNFYFAVSNAARPDTLYRVVHPAERETLERLIDTYGNWQAINTYYTAVKNLQATAFQTPTIDTINPTQLIAIQGAANDLLLNYSDKNLQGSLQTLNQATQNSSQLKAQVAQLTAAYTELKRTATPNRCLIPRLVWYGTNNRYHIWLTGALCGNFGTSYQDQHPISDTIGERIGWTLLISAISLLLTYLIAIPLGVYSATHRGTRIDNWLTTLLFALYSVPSFLVATLFVIFLCQPDYLNWFPPYGLGDNTFAINGIAQTVCQRIHHLVLPICVVTYTQIAFLSRQMRGGLLQTLRADYIRTAYAKGLSTNTVVQKHALRNAILPIITLFANIFPSLIAGSFIAETIFTLPGMGRLAYQAIVAHDYPTVFAVVLLSAFMTIIGYIVADILYVVADPRIRLS